MTTTSSKVSESNESVPKSPRSRLSSGSSFSFFKNEENFPSSVAALVTFGVAHVLLGCLPIFAFSAASFALGVFICQWNAIHANKMTRREIIYFDEKNLLETSEGLEFNYGPILEGSTPISGPDVNPNYPTNLWQALFCDEKQLHMQKFYREHYGPVWATAQKHEREMKMQKEMNTARSTATTENEVPQSK